MDKINDKSLKKCGKVRIYAKDIDNYWLFT